MKKKKKSPMIEKKIKKNPKKFLPAALKINMSFSVFVRSFAMVVKKKSPTKNKKNPTTSDKFIGILQPWLFLYHNKK